MSTPECEAIVSLMDEDDAELVEDVDDERGRDEVQKGDGRCLAERKEVSEPEYAIKRGDRRS